MKNLLFYFLLVSCLSVGCHTQQKKSLTIATAANVQFAMEELIQVFSEETGINSEIILGSSGKLTAQIKAGAPYDLFVSADMKFPEDLYQNGFAQNKPQIYAYGKLVLWTLKKDFTLSVDSLKSPQIKHIALANPKTAPYGTAAVECMEYFKVFGDVSSKLVYGESIAQTNQFILSASAEAGFTAKSVLLSPKMNNQGQWLEIDQKSYTPIAQGAVVLKNKDRAKIQQAEKFYAFLFSEKAKKILLKYGYEIKS